MIEENVLTAVDMLEDKMENIKFEIRVLQDKKKTEKNMYKSILIMMGTFIGAFLGFSCFRLIQDLPQLGNYQSPAIFWVSHLILPGFILIFFTVFFVMHLMKAKREIKKLDSRLLDLSQAGR